MKIIHCADIHIGSVMESLTAEKAKVRKRELIDTFSRMVDFAKENNVRAVVIAGDFFDKRTVAQSTKKEILDKISSVPEIDFLYLAGNHDEKTDLSDSGRVAPKNLLAFDAGSEWKVFNYEDVCIAGIEVSKQTGDGFYEKLRFDGNKINIAVMHGDLKQIRIDRLKNKNINYLALGHIHIPDTEAKRIDSRGEYAYSGCLEGRDFGETGERGFFLLSAENGKIKREFCPIAKRKYQTTTVDITGCDSHSAIEAAVNKEISAQRKEDLIRIVLKGKYKADTQKETDNLKNKLDERFFFSQIKDESTLDFDFNDCTNGFSLRNEFVKLVKESDLAQQQKEKIIEYGIKALSGEGIDL